MNMQKCAIFVKRNLKMNMLKIKNIEKLGTIAIILEKAFHNGSNYVYHFTIKLLAEELVRYFTYLRPNAEKY